MIDLTLLTEFWAKLKTKFAEKTPVVTQLASSVINPNRITKLGELTGTIALVLATGDADKANIYNIIFSTGAVAPTIVWPSGISWAGGNTPTIAASKNYEVSISENLAIITDF